MNDFSPAETSFNSLKLSKFCNSISVVKGLGLDVSALHVMFDFPICIMFYTF